MSLSVVIFGIFVLCFSRVNADMGHCRFIGNASSATASSGENMVEAVLLTEGWEPATSSEKNPYIQVGLIGVNDVCNALEIQPDQSFDQGLKYPTKKLRFLRVAMSDDGMDWTFVRQHPKDRPHELGYGGLPFQMAFSQPFFVIFPWSHGKQLRIYPIRTNPEYGRFRFQVMQCYAYPGPPPWSCPAGKHKWIDEQSCLPDAVCGAGWSGNGGYCYKLFTSPKSYETAQSTCEAENADLLSMHSTEERNYINTNIIGTAADDVWIGLKDAEQVYYQWSDTTDNDYIYYDTSKMYDTGEFCVKINRQNSYKWEDTPCSSELPYICKQSSDCRRRLVGPVPGTTLTASVDSVTGHEPEQAKIVPSGPTNAGWRPLLSDEVYIQADLGSVHRVVGVIVKSSQYYDPVLWFTLHYSQDGNNFLPYMDGFVPKVFQGSRNDSMRTEMLPTEVSARSVQIHPKRWVGDVFTIWIELFGCPGTVSDPVPDGCVDHNCNGTCESIPGGARCLCPSGFRLGEDHHSCIRNGHCNYEPAGISDGFIKDSQISSNSEQGEDTAISVRPGGLKAWCTLVSSAKKRHFLTLDMKTVERVIGVELENIGDNSDSSSVQRYPYLKSYKVAFSFDGKGYQYIRTTDKFYHIDFDFPGFGEEARPYDRKIQYFRVTKARYIRLYPVLDLDTSACVRMEILLAPPISCTKPAISMCTRLDHGCSHRCVTTNSGYVCQCPDNYHLLADRKSCAKDARCGRFPEILFQGRCYEVNMDVRKHVDAIKDCHLFGGHLIDFQTLDELYFVTHKATFYNAFYTGHLYDNETEVTGNPVEAFKWEDEENLAIMTNRAGLFLSKGEMVHTHDTTWKPGLCKKYCEQYLISGRQGIDDTNMSASSEAAGFEAYKARIRVPSVIGWTPVNTTDAYLQVNFGKRVRLSGIITEPGDDGGVVTVYQMSCVYHVDGTPFVMYREQTSTRAFLGSSERITVIKMLEFPIDVYAIRIHPILWTGTNYRLKIEVLGCTAAALTSSTKRMVVNLFGGEGHEDNRRIYDNVEPFSFHFRQNKECVMMQIDAPRTTTACLLSKYPGWSRFNVLYLRGRYPWGTWYHTHTFYRITRGRNETFWLFRDLDMANGFMICNWNLPAFMISFEIFVDNGCVVVPN